MILFAGHIEHLEQARDYISKQGFTADDVAIKRKGDEINVITKDGLNPWTKQKHISLKESYSRNVL